MVEEFRQKYICHYNLRECAMMVRAVLPGSFTVVWYIPESIVEHLKNEVAKNILSKYAVTRLGVPGVCARVYNQVIVFSFHLHCSLYTVS